MSIEQKNYYTDLLVKMAKTRSARFGAAGSLIIKERISVSLVSALSIYMFGWAVISLAYPEYITPHHAKFFTIVSAVSAMAVLAITLMDQTFNRAIRSEKFQTNALQISQLMRELERLLIEGNPDYTRAAEIAEKYEQYVSQTAINHTPMDHRKAQYEKQWSQNICKNVILKITSMAYNVWFYASSMFVYFLVFLVVIGATATYVFKYVIGD